MRPKVSLYLSLVSAGLLFASPRMVLAQNAKADKLLEKAISQKQTDHFISTLAADDMEGRKFGTPGIRKAGAFIADAFKKAGLQTMPADSGYFQNFSIYTSHIYDKAIRLNGALLADNASIIVSTQPSIDLQSGDSLTILTPQNREELMELLMGAAPNTSNRLVILKKEAANLIPVLDRFTQNQFSSPYTTIYLALDQKLSSQDKISISAKNELTTQRLANIVGILPGKTKPNEYVIFSGHYDHLGIDANNKQDSIYNGANDDASGTTAVMQLANYYSKLGTNDRTLVFAAFTAEEAGGFGSKYFSLQFDPAKVMAMFNIEMIGTESKWGKNSAYITGYEKTNMGQILEQNLVGTGFSFYPDPYPSQQLFYRSDNATLARQGVPAHTISTSKMDAEPNYHKVSDEVSTLDLSNMNKIIQCIALSARTIVAAKDTPSRVNTSELKRR